MVIFFGCNVPQNNEVNSDPNISDPSFNDGDNDKNIGSELITIEEPGNLSEITSPVFVSGIAGPTFEQNLIVRVTDMYGNVLAEEVTTILADIGKAGAYMVQLEFSVEAEIPGRISVFDVSAMNGALLHVASVPVTLLASGTSTINVNEDNSEVIEIHTPELNQEVGGGKITVTGVSEYFFESSLVVALCGTGGTGPEHYLCGAVDNFLGLGYAMIDSPDMGIGGPFSGTISFAVEEEMPAILQIFAISPMDGSIEHLSSVTVILKP